MRLKVVVGEFCEMWAKLIVSVTLLPMLVHSVVGCCWHHVHADGKLNCVQSTTETHSGHGHHHDLRTEKNDPVAPEPCDHEESCNDVRCVYLVAELVRSANPFDLNEEVVAFDCCCLQVLNATTLSWKNPQQFQNAPLPSQHCALTQVWVV